MRARPLCLTLAAATLCALAAAPGAQAAPRLTACPDQDDFGCGTLRVPLDRAGAVAGTVPLRYAIRRRPRRAPVLLALSGGPGQPSVESAGGFSLSLEPALTRYRLAVLDQRGTGRSGPLSCPAVQRLRSLDPFSAKDVGECAQRIGPRRAFYGTPDSVLDIEALRVELGVERLALMGISYGTWVAQQYARAFPDRVDRLILDSVVGPGPPDGFLLDTYRAFPRVLQEQCARSACRGITRDPAGDVGAVVARLGAGRPLRGRVFDDRGRARRTSYSSGEELAFLLLGGDLNPFLQAALPAAVAAARDGDPSLLLRLRRVGQGPATRRDELNFGLNVATGCADARLAYALTTPPAERPALVEQALAAVPPTDYDPFDARTVLASSYVDDCLLWPADQPKQPFAGPLPDVPALLLGGGLDLRTPYENAQALAAQLPRATLVRVRGTGHDTVDSDLSGCTATAVSRFVRRRAVGRPCAGKDNQVDVMPRPPRSLRAFRSAPGVGGTRGRALFAVLDTVNDARVSSLQVLYAGLPQRGGGLHGGSFSGLAAAEETVRLRGYSYVPGLRVTGSLADRNGALVGRLSVRGRTRASSGFLVFDRPRGVTGRLGGRAVRYSGRIRRTSSAARSVEAGRRVAGPVVPEAPRELPPR